MAPRINSLVRVLVVLGICVHTSSAIVGSASAQTPPRPLQESAVGVPASAPVADSDKLLAQSVASRTGLSPVLAAQAGTPLEQLLQAGLAGATALRDEARYRIEQAQEGQGGIDARPEDIASAQAKLAADKVALRLRQPFADVRYFRAFIALWEGTVRSGQNLRDACGDLRLTTVIRYKGDELQRKLRSDLNCPDSHRDALSATIDLARSQQTQAELELKRWTDPAPTILNFYGPYEQEVIKSEQQIQKLQTGGTFDDSALELYLALAQADVDTLLMLAQGSAGGALQAQLQAAKAELGEAQYRQEQARTGQGGIAVRPQDIAQAEADIKAAEANLGLLLNPLTEQVQQAEQGVAGAQAAVKRASEAVEACDDFRATSKLVENDDGEVSLRDVVRDILDNNLSNRFPNGISIPIPGLPPIDISIVTDRILNLVDRILASRGITGDDQVEVELDTRFRCDGDARRELEADVDASNALLVGAEQQYKLLTNPSVPQILYVIEPNKQEVVAASARLQKLKTGGEFDQIALDLRAARAQARVDSLEALLAGAPATFAAAQLRGAQAGLRAAEARVEQARQGQGGVGARLEDIAMAEAALASNEAKLQQILNPMPELIRAAEAAVDLAEAAVGRAEWARRGCNGPVAKTTTEVDNEELDEESFASTSCSDDLEDALEAVVEQRKAERQVAQVNLKMLTDPSDKLLRNLVEPAKARIAAAQAQVQKLKTGGLQDQAKLDLDLALAAAEVDFWQAALNGSPRAQVEAQQRAARAMLAEAEYRRQQAQQGLGGVGARPEDIAIAESAQAITQAQLLEIVDPTQEQLWIAEANLAAAGYAQDAARSFREACDDPRTVTVSRDSDNADDDNNDNDDDSVILDAVGPQLPANDDADNDNSDDSARSILQPNCPSGRKDALVANIDRAQALVVAAEQQLKLLKDPTFPQIGYVIEPYRQAVIGATALVDKLKTGNNRDAISLDLDVDLARAEVDRLEAVLAGSLAGELNARLAGAKAEQSEAEYRLAQAQQGQGGVGARAQDIAMAEAGQAAATARLQSLLNPPAETVQTARSQLDAAEAGVRAAEGEKDACGHQRATVTKKERGQTVGPQAILRLRCSDDQKDVLSQGVTNAEITRDIAAQQVKLLVDPAQPQILYLIGPLQQAVVITTAQVQKLKTGGDFDQTALELRATSARSEVERWQAMLANDPVAAARAQLEGARTAESVAKERVQQAATATGGPRVRAEDIAQAEAQLVSAQAQLQLAMDPLQEVVTMAQLSLKLSESATAQARAAAQACGDARISTRFVDNESNDDDDDNSNDNALRLTTDLRCTDDQRDALEAIADGLEGYQLAPTSIVSLLTEICCNEKLQVLITGYQAQVTQATQRLEKAKTGGPDDASRLNLYAASASAVAGCRSAVVGLAATGSAALSSPPPFAWSNPDPCALGQLPGKIPPFLMQDVRPVSLGRT
jgi:hypothetical protein